MRDRARARIRWFAVVLVGVLTIELSVGTVLATASGTSSSLGLIAGPLLPQGLYLAPVHDPSNGNLYIAGDDYTTNGVVVGNANGTETVISGVTNQVLQTVGVGLDYDPTSTTIDPLTGDVYVLCVSSLGGDANGYLSVLSGATGAEAYTVPLNVTPQFDALDLANGDLYVSGVNGIGWIKVISPGTDTPIAVYNYSFDPRELIWLASTDPLYALGNGTTIASIVPGNGTVEESTGLAATADATLYDPVSGYIYVGVGSYTGTYDQVAVFSPATGSIVTTISVPGQSLFLGPQGDVIAFQPGAPANVSVISPLSDEVVSEFTLPETLVSLAYDPGNGLLVGDAWDTEPVTFWSATTGALVDSVALPPGDSLRSAPVYDFGNGEIYLIATTSSTIFDSQVVVVGSVSVAAPSGAAWVPILGGGAVGFAAGAAVVVLLRRVRRTRDSTPP